MLTQNSRFSIINNDGEDTAKAEARAFMSETKSYVDEIIEMTEWTTKVMQSDVPVILDCYAE